jgi:probable F420-dependent oxidoreductase
VTRDILGPEKWIVSEQAVTVGGTPEDQLQWAHGHLNVYSGLPNYRNSWIRQGFEESDLVRGGSDRLAGALVTTGSVDDAAASLRAHLDAGADHVVLQVVGDNPMADPRPALRELAAALELG